MRQITALGCRDFCSTPGELCALFCVDIGVTLPEAVSLRPDETGAGPHDPRSKCGRVLLPGLTALWLRRVSAVPDPSFGHHRRFLERAYEHVRALVDSPPALSTLGQLELVGRYPLEPELCAALSCVFPAAAILAHSHSNGPGASESAGAPPPPV